MQSERKDFQALRLELLEHLKKQTIPPKMRSKLLFLARRIRGQQIKPEQLPELEQDQIDLLEQLNESGKINLFMSVTRCILGKQDLDFVIKKQAYVKKDAMFAFWHVCYITYDSNSITITKKKPLELQLKDLKISSKVKKGKTKYSFVLHSSQGKYRIGFTNEKIANDLHNKFKQLIMGAGEDRSSKIMENSQSESPSKMDETVDVGNMEVMEELEQEQYGKKFAEEYDALNLEDDSEFKLEKHIDSGRILRHESRPNTFKAVVLIDVPSAQSVLNFYAQTKQWNTELADSSIISRIDDCTYICYERYKAYSFSSWARDFVIIKSGIHYLGHLYLFEKSIEHQNYLPNSLMVRGNLVKKATVFINKPNCQGTLLITQIEIDFAGRNSIQDNKNMAVQYLSAYDKFPKYCMEKSFMQTPQRLFSFKKKSTRRQSQEIKILPTELTNNIMKQKNEPIVPKGKRPFIQLLQQYIDDDIPEELFERLKTEEQNYHNLKHKYSMQRIEQGKRYQIPKDDFVFQNGSWIVNENNEMVFVNQKAIDAQKDVIKYILRQIGSNLLAGKSVMNMSLPVEIFDSRSILQRSAASMGYTPSLFVPAGKSTNELQQMLAVATHMLTLTLLELRIQKPFNPILGETFQGYVAGIPVYLQQISHHPPISYIYMKCNQFTLYGSIILAVEMGLNSANGTNTGVIHIVFPNGTHFEYIMPEGEISGLIYGDRKFKMINKGFVYQRNRLLFCEVSLGKDKDVYGLNKKKLNGSEFAGGVFKVTQEFMNKFLAEKKKSKCGGITKKDVVDHLGTIEGCWNGDFILNGKLTKKLYEPLPHKLQYQLYPLASNSNYREDILYRRLGNLAQSQISKQILENLQRSDRNSRKNKKH